MQKIKITKREKWNWYKVGAEYTVRDSESYKPLGVQVYKANNGREPDIVQFGHFKYI